MRAEGSNAAGAHHELARTVQTHEADSLVAWKPGNLVEVVRPHTGGLGSVDGARASLPPSPLCVISATASRPPSEVEDGRADSKGRLRAKYCWHEWEVELSRELGPRELPKEQGARLEALEEWAASTPQVCPSILNLQDLTTLRGLAATLP